METIWKCLRLRKEDTVVANQFLTRDVSTIFIMLGNSCNLNCEYCLQHPLIEKELPKEINEDIYQFIYETALEQKHLITLQFYGGEPLVYFDTIKQIVSITSNMKIKFHYSIITNGKLLNEEIVDFLNHYNFGVAISWDGHTSDNTRHYNVFQSNECVYKINHLSISSVISAYSYPKQILDDRYNVCKKYHQLHNYFPEGVLDIIMDTCLNNRELLHIDMNKIRQDYEFLLRNYIYSINKEFDKVEDNYTVVHFNYVKSLINMYQHGDNEQSALPKCSNGYSVLNLDLKGNLYSCHNTSVEAGTIYSTYWQYLSNVIKNDNSIKNMDTCFKCKAYRLCRGGCKLLDKNVRDSYYCEINNIIYEVVQKYCNIEKGDKDE